MISGVASSTCPAKCVIVTLYFRYKDKEGQAIVILARRHLPTTPAACTGLLQGLVTEETLANDIYSKVPQLNTAPLCNAVPAAAYTDTHRHALGRPACTHGLRHAPRQLTA